MLKNTSTCFITAIVLQFAVFSGAHAFNDDVLGNWTTVPAAQSSIQLDVLQLSQNRQATLRSRSDVIQEVKRRYNAEILKVSLDERKQMYRVRVLMPNGKVRNLQISARR